MKPCWFFKNIKMKLFTRIKYGLPLKYEKIWYNRAMHIHDEHYPIVYDDNSRYIDCVKGLNVIMGKTKDGRSVYYRINKTWKTRGSDWLYPSDAINCNMIFSHVSKKQKL